MDIKVLGINLGKTVCILSGLGEAGAVVFRKRLQRHRLVDFLDGLPPCVVAMEACGGAHHIGLRVDRWDNLNGRTKLSDLAPQMMRTATPLHGHSLHACAVPSVATKSRMPTA